VSKKIYTGKVISNRMDKTIVVAVTRLFQHPVYKKTVKRDMVKIIETRPLSKEKRWTVIE
jgi:small subunit ribosomal protein S17